MSVPLRATSLDVATPKAELLQLFEDFKAKQEAMWDVMEEESKLEKPKGKKAEKSRSSLFEAESFASQSIQLSDELVALRNKTVAAIHCLAELNPTPRPVLGWRGFGGAPSSECVLNGTWKLLFTDAADATFKRGKRGNASTSQEIDAEQGWFVNCVDFSAEKSKLRGFRVFVEGRALSDNEMQLLFRKVRLLRRSRWPKLFGQITIPLPSPDLLRNIGRFFAKAKGGKVNPSDRGAGFRLLYVDDDLRIHQTFDGLFFAQRRLS